jgi:hypothetical protein
VTLVPAPAVPEEGPAEGDVEAAGAELVVSVDDDVNVVVMRIPTAFCLEVSTT